MKPFPGISPPFPIPAVKYLAVAGFVLTFQFADCAVQSTVSAPATTEPATVDKFGSISNPTTSEGKPVRRIVTDPVGFALPGSPTSNPRNEWLFPPKTNVPEYDPDFPTVSVIAPPNS
jgi:hypothetical protein